MNSAPFINNFSSGQLSRKFDARFDVNARYHSGAKEITNMFINHFGNAFKAPGTFHIDNGYNDNGKNVLMDFVYSESDALVLEFSNIRMRVIKDGAIIQSGGSDYVLSTPYTESDLYNIVIAQDKDIAYIVDGAHFPRKLTRSADNSWTIELAPLEWGPTLPMNLTTTTLACDVTAKGDTGTLTASATLFDNDHYDTTEGGAIFLMADGYVKITGTPTSSTSAPIEVMEDLTSGTATTDWYEGAFSKYRGYPKAISFHESRLFFGGTEYSKKRTWGSTTFVYENFKETSDDDSALNYDIAANKNNIIRWLDSGKTLGIGASGSIRNLSTGTETAGLTPDNFRFVQETSIGTNGVTPVVIDDAVYYVSSNGQTLREFVYNFQSNSMKSVNMNLAADDLFNDSIIQMAVQHFPFDMIWVVTSGGTLLTFTRNQEHNIMAWCIHDFDGDVESVAVIPNGLEDMVVVSVKRTINGGTERHIEYFDEHYYGDDVEDAHFVRDGIVYDGVATTTITGLGHLEGKTVAVLKDGANHPTKVVSGGQITLDREGEKVHVGVGYKSTLQTLPLEGGSMNGTSQGKKKRVRSASVRLYNSVGFSLSVNSNDGAVTPAFRSPSIHQGDPIPLFTGDKVVKLPDAINRESSIIIESDVPLPLHVLGIFPLMRTSDV